MKTKSFFKTLLTLSLVIFGVTSGISNPANNYTGDNLKKNENKVASVNKAETVSDKVADEFSYLRFDVNNYMHENAVAEAVHTSLDYLRFDVNNFITENESGEMELPVANEFEYLRFDVSNFTESSFGSLSELPENEFDYLRFDVNKFAGTSEGVIDELPITE